MTRDEARTLLGYAAATTRDWTPTSLDVDVWTDLLADVPFDDCRQALADFARTTHHRPVPADIRAGVKRLRADRLERAPYAVPAADPDDVTGYLADLRAQRHWAAEGLTARPMVTLASGQRVLAIAAETAEQMPTMPKPGYAPPPPGLVERFRRSLPRRHRSHDLSHTDAVADMDRMLADHQEAPEPADAVEPDA